MRNITASHAALFAATLLVFVIMLIPAQTMAQAIYKVVDAEGNVTYTDQPPSKDAQPLDLQPVTVADPFKSQSVANSGSTDGAIEDLVPYADLRLLSPSQEQHFWGTGGTFTAQVASNQPLSRGHLVRFLLDGSVAGTGTGMFMEFSNIDRGEHRMQAEIVTPGGEVLAKTESVVFFMRQQSVINRARNN